MSLNVLQNVKLAPYTSWLIGGEAEYFCAPANLDELREALLWLQNHRPELSQDQLRNQITILGGGSNVLISDRGIKGLTICLKKLNQVSVETKLKSGREVLCIMAQAGTAKTELLKIFLKYKLAPALFMAGLPGDVGGGVVMNAGVAEMYEPREFMEIVDSIEVMNMRGELLTLGKEQLQIKYRHTDGWQPHIVVAAEISWPLVQDQDVLTKVREANKVRSAKQPLDKPSCGSVFKNPAGGKAAQLIDQCGLKGFQIGDAQVSLKHANFIVNLGQATAQDTWNLIQHVKKVVHEKTGVSIETEVVRLGDWTT